MLFRLISENKFLILFSSFLSMLSALAGIALIAHVNEYLSDINNARESFKEGLSLMVLGVIALIIFGVFSQFILTKLGASIVERLRDVMAKRILSTSYSNLEKIGGHRVYATITGDVRTISDSLSILPLFAYNFTAVALGLLYMGYSSLELFLIVFSMLTVAVLVAKVILNKGIKSFEALRECDDELFSNFKALVEGGKELNINSNRKRFFYNNILVPITGKIKRSDIKAKMFFVYITNWANATLFISMGVVVFSSQYFLPQVTVEVMIRFVFVMIYLMGPLSFLVDSFEDISNGIVANRKIASLNLSEELTEFDSRNEIETNDNWSELALRDVYFKYKENESSGFQFEVGPINVSFKRGEVTFITGGNGSGKSTFAKLLTGLYNPDRGDILIDGEAVDYINAGESYRRNFSTIFSDFYVFKQALNRDGELASDEQVQHYLKRLSLEDKVTVKDGCLSTVELSHGQKKRLALVLSYLEDSPVCLFDEWAADQDPYFRQFFYQELLPELKNKGKSVIVISHDDRYFSSADKLYKFESGKANLVSVKKESKEVLNEGIV
ncbi:cyclic peptide transporter [Pseudoalteromonas sp. HM-SA03]|uniref:cyclic peptide export ABC transporter n=1 Tax=Pseudoalteromonas sp. HM-SA03 TaxID=2029678 RepID=UPI000BAE47A7|nr:cyclic peptide export ABC transporter [Pseudoalteromonas sp. HM-SA03]PAX99275.1 cyclic peptide transporter [Pseudoalteromonas sp. HM-SA03]